MKYFIIEGILKTQNPIDENTMQEHMAYSKKAMDEGLILMSGLKSNMSGGIFIMKAESIEKVQNYLSSEPFKLCLLYTSPSPRDRTRSRMPSSA